MLKDFASVIRKHLYILYLNKEVREIFTPSPMVSFRGVRKLGSYLVRAKLYPLERSVGSFKCNDKQCQVFLNVTETKAFSSTITKKEYKFGKSKSNLLKISKNLLISEQINHSGMLSTYPVLNTDISTSHNASSSSIRSRCASADLSLDTHDQEILSILEELKCSLYQGMVEECIEQHRLN